MRPSENTGRFSLVQRVTQLAIVVSVVAALMHVALQYWLVRPVLDNGVSHLGSELQLARELLLHATPAERADLPRRLASMGVTASEQPPAEPRVATLGTPLPTPMLAMLASQIEPALRLYADGTSGQLHFVTEIEGHRWWLSVAAPQQPAATWLLLLLAPIVLLGLAAAMALILGLRLIARPLAALSAQLRHRSERLSPLNLPANASSELCQLVESFNQLVVAAERAAAERRNLLLGLSHDLRTPLARLQLRVDCECDATVAARLEPDFVQLSRIIGQFLSYAQTESGAPLGQTVPAGRLVQQVVDGHPQAGLSLFMGAGAEISTGVPELALRRVLGNLIDNALDYGEPPVEVLLQEQPQALELWVLDAGTGIPPEQFQRALEPFVKLRNASQSVGHCGLGLSIVAQLASQLGGRVVLRNFDGQRTGVGVRIPLPQPGQGSAAR